MRICFVCDTCLPMVGGAEMLTVREARALGKMGHDVQVTTLRHRPEWQSREVVEGLQFRRTGGLFLRGKLRLRFGAQWLAEALLFRELVRTRDTYDLLHLRQLTFLTRAVALASIVTGKPVIVQVANASPAKELGIRPGTSTTMYAGTLDPHASYLQIPARSWGTSDIEVLRRWQWTANLTLRLLRQSKVTVLAVSRRIRSELLEEGFRSQQIELLPTGIEPEAYAESAAAVEARAAADIAPPVVLCVAKYRFQKGLDILLHAWSLVQQQVAGAQLWLSGGGPLQDQLEAMIRDLGLTQSVQLLGQSRNVPSLLGQVDVFVLPSRYEGMSNALLEAMAAGLPCVATEVSGSEENIVPGQSGLLVPPGDPEALAQALITVLSQPAYARELGRAARARVAEHYDRQTLMLKLIDLYTNCIASASSVRKTHTPEASAPPEPPIPIVQTAVEEEAANR